MLMIPPEAIALVSAFIAAVSNTLVAPIATRYGALLVSAVLTTAMAVVFLLLSPFVLGSVEPALTLSRPALYVVLGAAPILTVGTLLYWVSVRRLGTSVAYPIASSYPLVVSFLWLWLSGEAFSALKLVGTAAILAGVSLVTVTSSEHGSPKRDRRQWLALLTAFLTMLCWSGNTILVKLAVDEGLGVFTVNLLRMPVMAVLLCLALFFGRRGTKIEPMSRKALLVLLLAALINGAQDLLYFYTLQASSLSTVVPLASTAPLFVMLMALLFLKERVTLPRAAGTILTVVGIIILA